MKKIEVENIVWKEGSFFVAECLNVEVSSFGDTRVEALLNLNEALELYFEDEALPEIASIENPEIVHSQLTYA